MIDLKRAHFLITGGSGFMGSGLIRYLLSQEGFCGKVFNLDALTYAAHPATLDPFHRDPRYELVVAEIGNSEKIEALHSVHRLDVIVHFAAETHVDQSIANAAPFVETNVVGTYKLLEWVRYHPTVHFHHISTDEVYGSLGETGSFTTTSPYRPTSPYAASKAASDHFVLAYARTFGLACTLSQACNNYGPYQFPEKFIPLMVIHSLRAQPLPLYGDGNHRREWLHVDDHARAVMTILAKGKQGGIYPITSGEEMKNRALLDLILQTVACKTKKALKIYQALITPTTDRLGHDFRYALDAKEIKTLGWQPRTSLKEEIGSVVDWYLTHLNSIESNGEGRWRWSHRATCQAAHGEAE